MVIAWYVLFWLALLAAVIYVFARRNSLASVSSVILLGIFIVFSILAAPRTRLFACLSLTTLVVPFYLFEIYLWLTTALMAPDPGSSKAEYITKLREQGLAAYPAVFPSGFLRLWQRSGHNTLSPIVIGGREILPLAGIPDVLTVYCLAADGRMLTYGSDSFGFRNPTRGSFMMARAANPQLALLGDSFVQGSCVSDAFTYGQQLSALGPTLSYGMNGTSALAQLAIFREYVKPTRPHHIVWFFFEGNDPREYMDERSWPLLRAYFAGGHLQDLANLSTPIALAMRRFVDERLEGDEVANAGNDWVRLAQNRSSRREMVDLLLLRRAKTALRETWRTSGPSAEMTEAEWREVTDIWHEVINTQRVQGGQITFVYIPARDRFLKDPVPFHALEGKVRGLWSDLGVDYVLLTEQLEATGNPVAYYEPRGIHFNEKGYYLTGEAIIEHLRHSPDG